MYNGSFRDFNMAARDPSIPLSWDTFNNCLFWKKSNTPLMPVTTSWDVVLRVRNALLKEGQKNVVIIAIWSKGMHNVYDAHEITRQLRQLRREDPEKGFQHHHEYLVHGGISADEDRVLAIFDGQGQQTNIPLSLQHLAGSVTIPDTFMLNTPGKTAKKKLQFEIYQRTGVDGDSKQLLYLIGFMIGAFDCWWTSFEVVEA
jgi:hypothetical protein